MSPTHRHHHEGERLWGLGLLAAILSWFEEFLNTINGLALMIGAGIAVTDLLTDGQLSRLSDAFVYAWAVSQALGIEVQLLSAFARARQAQRTGATGAMIGWLFLGVILLLVTFLAGYVYSLVRTEHISTDLALAQLGISTFAFLGVRALLAAGLVALSGWTSYVSTPTVPRSADEEVAAIERQAKVAAAKAQYRRQQAANVVGIAKAAATAAFSREDHENDLGSPAAADDDESGETNGLDGEPATPMTGNPTAAVLSEATRWGNKRSKRIFTFSEARRLRQAKENGSAERRVFAFLERHPDASLSQIVDATGVGKATAAKYRQAFRQRQASENVAQ